MQQLKSGTLLQGGKYRIERVLGQGGFGITYLATHVELNSKMAIKEFFMKEENMRVGNAVTVPNTTKAGLFSSQKEKFKKEARRVFEIKNDHLVTVYDLFEENGTAYYVMDFVDGISLSESLKRTGKPLDESEVSIVLIQIMDALKEVHKKSIWHLDIKPGNILKGKNGQLYLIDFGASKEIHSDGAMTTSTALCYTPGYAPNEQVGQIFSKFGPWTDLYALGATAYNLLTNEKPPMSIDIDDVGQDAFRFPESVSSQMRDLVMWMMQPKMKDRPQSVDEIIAILCRKGNNDETIVVGEPKETGNGDETILEQSKSNLPEVIQQLIDNMVFVEGGSFNMGRDLGLLDFLSNEGPVHKVTLSSYSIGKYEVTREEWETVMGNPSSDIVRGKHPVVSVSWNDCQKFIKKLNELTGKNFRLPTEAEWEFAARGGNKSRGYKYAGSNRIDDVAWYEGNSGGYTHEVGRKRPNELGLFDMSGNVWEWCQDFYENYISSDEVNPTGPISGTSYVDRGGSMYNSSSCCRVSYRDYSTPQYRSNLLGFRLAL